MKKLKVSRNSQKLMQKSQISPNSPNEAPSGRDDRDLYSASPRHVLRSKSSTFNAGCIQCIPVPLLKFVYSHVHQTFFFEPLQNVLKLNEIPGGPESQKSENMSRAFGADFPKYEPRLRRGFPKIRAAPSARIPPYPPTSLEWSRRRSEIPLKIALGVSRRLWVESDLELHEPFVNVLTWMSNVYQPTHPESIKAKRR